MELKIIASSMDYEYSAMPVVKSGHTSAEPNTHDSLAVCFQQMQDSVPGFENAHLVAGIRYPTQDIHGMSAPAFSVSCLAGVFDAHESPVCGLSERCNIADVLNAVLYAAHITTRAGRLPVVRLATQREQTAVGKVAGSWNLKNPRSPAGSKNQSLKRVAVLQTLPRC